MRRGIHAAGTRSSRNRAACSRHCARLWGAGIHVWLGTIRRNERADLGNEDLWCIGTAQGATEEVRLFVAASGGMGFATASTQQTCKSSDCAVRPLQRRSSSSGRGQHLRLDRKAKVCGRQLYELARFTEALHHHRGSIRVVVHVNGDRGNLPGPLGALGSELRKS
jgi:hypothetical protein